MKPEPVMQSARLNPLKGRSGKRETAVTCTLYEARRNQASVRQETMDIVRQRLININPQIPFVHLLESTASKNIETQLGAFPDGSVCSYQLANMEPGFEVIGSFEVSNRLTLDKESRADTTEDSTFPPFPLKSSQTVNIPVSIDHLNYAQREKLDELTSQSTRLNIVEAQTRQQRQCFDWAKVREFRLNSSTHRVILHRRTVTKKFCVALNKPIGASRAMQHGINNEDKPKFYYSRVTGNTVLPCGYVIDTTAPWLGTSPDGKVINKRLTKPYGLIEVKCPYKWRDSKPSDACADPSFYCAIDGNGKPFLKG